MFETNKIRYSQIEGYKIGEKDKSNKKISNWYNKVNYLIFGVEQ